MEKLICVECKNEVPITAMINHLKKNHYNLSLYEQILIHQKSLTTAEIKIKYFMNEFIDRFLKEVCIDDLKVYAKQIYLYAKKFNNFCDMIIKFRDMELKDIDIFFNLYLPYKKDHPKDVNSFALAEIVCYNHQEQTQDFYKKVLLFRNAYAGHGGELSPWSKKFKSYQGISENEKEKVIRQKIFCKDRNDFNKLKKNHNCSIEYYLTKGMTEEEAKKALSERQSTFSLKKCIKKYGEEEGIKRFKERQEKWLKSLDTPENKEKIKQGQLKGFKSTMGKGYSEISQQLFNSIKNKLPKNLNILYATNGGEYIVDCSPIKHPMLDFYIPSLKCWIEFDGDYWHGEARGNQERDRKREEALKEVIPDINLKRVSEREYKKDPTHIINECVDWINSLMNK